MSDGPEKLTARSLADALNTSGRPIFTAFTNMDELKSSLFILGFKWGMTGAFVAVLTDEAVRAVINTTRFLRLKVDKRPAAEPAAL